MDPPPKSPTGSPPTYIAVYCSVHGGFGHENEGSVHKSPNISRPEAGSRSPFMQRLISIFAPLPTGCARVQNICNASAMVGNRTLNFSEVQNICNASAMVGNRTLNFSESPKEDGFWQDNEGFVQQSGKLVAYLKTMFLLKMLPVEDLTSFSGDYCNPASTARLDDSWHDFSAMVRYEMALAGIARERFSGMDNFAGPSRFLLRRLYYQRKVVRDLNQLKKRSGETEKLVHKLEQSTAKGFEDLLQDFKEISSKNKEIIEDGLVAIKEASKKDEAALKAAFDDLKEKLNTMEKKEIAPFLDKMDQAVKTLEIPLLMRLRLKKLWGEIVYISMLMGNIALFLGMYGEGKPEPTPLEPSPVEEDPSVPPVELPIKPFPSFYKSIGRNAKDLLYKNYCLAPCITTKIKVQLGRDEMSYVSLLVATDNSKITCKASYGLVEDKVRCTLSAGVPKLNPKAKLFYAFPSAGVNVYLNASLVCGAIPSLKLALSCEKAGLVAGAKVAVNPSTSELKQHEIGASYGPGAVKLVNGDVVKVLLYDGLSHGFAGGLEFKYTKSSKEAVISGALAVRLNDDTHVKAKLESTGTATASLRHCLSDRAEAAACVQFRLGEATRFGCSFKSSC